MNGRAYFCNGDAGDCEQPTENQLWGHAVAKEQHARNQGEHRKQQTEGCDAAHGATGDQPEPKAKPNNSSDENCAGECQPTTTSMLSHRPGMTATVIASEAKQSMPPLAALWIASLRAQ